MPQPTAPYRVCPTRTDGRAVLVAQKVTAGVCQDRQRGRYHKCFSCAYNNAWVERYGLPAPPDPARRLVPALVAVEELEPTAAVAEGETIGETAVEPEPELIPGPARVLEDDEEEAARAEVEATKVAS